MTNCQQQQSFAQQLQFDAERRGRGRGRGPTQRHHLHSNSTSNSERFSLADAVGSNIDEITMPFQSKFAPTEMRQLALVAHNHMKPAMKQFIETYSEILKKFRITGTETTMKMCKTMWGEDDPSIHYGLTCTSGPLGGDAQIAALMCLEDLGGMIFFLDPLSAHPHQADIDSLLRLANCGNIVVCPNPASASSMMHTLKAALSEGSRGMIPSFFETLESPAVERFKHQQAMALAHVIKRDSLSAPVSQASAAAEEHQEEKKAMEEGGSRRKPARKLTLTDGAIDRALFGQSMVVGDKDLQALLSAEVDNESYSREGDVEDDDVAIVPSTTDVAVAAPAPQAQAQEELVEVEDANTNRNNTMAVPSTSISHRVRGLDRVSMEMGQSFMLDYSSHLHALMEMDDEDKDDGSEGGDGGSGGGGGGDEVATAPIAKAKANVLKDLFGFKSSSLMSSKGKGRMNVKKKLSKSMRKLSPTLPRQYSESEKVQAEGQARENGEDKNDSRNDEEFLMSMEQRTNTLEQGQSELLVLMKKQMELIEMLKDQHNRNHA